MFCFWLSGKWCEHKRKNKLEAFLLSILIGTTGADRFYLGFIGVRVFSLYAGRVIGQHQLLTFHNDNNNCAAGSGQASAQRAGLCSRLYRVLSGHLL